MLFFNRFSSDQRLIDPKRDFSLFKERWLLIVTKKTLNEQQLKSLKKDIIPMTFKSRLTFIIR
ncbi:protein of unknown function [Methylotuvimicrobium alcaliphilum 20Z]|uniref:Uncharacterized protein n=1 Tax=Methylotuvimicrobium alcaliphilum (strain DSM 19304 / NCIMB 14124 / VKM B-2133 / 20Z) TaxID=1091494 RepID=G4SZD2_META2|nr:protein of unknown function [Methylotuvimicrobium alcaliphilum 20Z]